MSQSKDKSKRDGQNEETIWYVVTKYGTPGGRVNKSGFYRTAESAKEAAEWMANGGNQMDWVQTNAGYVAEDADGYEVLVAPGDLQ